MSHVQSNPCSAVAGFGVGPERQTLAREESASPRYSVHDYAFIALQNVNRPHWGPARVQCLAAGGWIESEERECEVAGLVDLIGLFSFPAYDARRLSMLQFDLPGATVRAGSQHIEAEPVRVRGVDDWALASRLAQPSSLLARGRPIEFLFSRLLAVLGTACADCTVTTRSALGTPDHFPLKATNPR